MVGALDERKLGILRFLARRTLEGEGSPSVREVGAAVGLRSTRSVHGNLGRLEKDGYVERAGGQHRSLRLTEKGWEAVSTLPHVGRVAAGRGLEAISDEAPYSLVAEILRGEPGGRVFFVTATGDSMTGAGIEERDVLVVREDPSPPDGSEVVAEILHEGSEPEGTVKVLRREGEMVRLEPRNESHEDIVVEAGRVRVRGTVEWVIRRMRGRR
jgi:repressor LexA